MASRARRIVLWIAISLVVLLAVPLIAVYSLVRASLPDLDGTVELPGLTGPVWIERDALGIPTIEGVSRTDVAFGTGFVHGQDRFFQMDLSRRLAAGELSPLFGDLAREQDARALVFGFREVARKVIAQATPQEHALIDAYTRGVNAGLASLGSRPWEYWLLRSEPAAWRPEDLILVAHAMWWDLQYSGFRREIVRRTIEARAPGAMCFLYPERTSWDSPNEASQNTSADTPCEKPPPATVLDVRGAGVGPMALVVPERSDALGSNNWVIGGERVAAGTALVANDMHLNLRVPNVWYRVRLRVSSEQAQDSIDLNGITLPGTPLLIAGSNGRIAWGYTNSYGNWLDVIPAPCGGAGVLFQRGPEQNQCWYAHWLAAVPEATNLRLLSMERASSVEQALQLTPQIGIPHQNAVIGDREGHIAWTIFGRIPRATDASRNTGVHGWTDAQDHPYILDPAAGYAWTANTRPSDSAAHVTAIGGDEAAFGSDFELGARARQIRDRLAMLGRGARPADMLAIQLDDRAIFLKRWQQLLTELLDDAAVREKPERAQFSKLIATLEPRADVDAVAYRFVRAFHNRTERAVWQMILHALHVGAVDAPPPGQFEEPLWTLVTQRPLHMVSADYADWRAFLLSQVDATMADLREACPDLSRCTWGSRGPVRIRHPLSAALPFLSGFLDMPSVELPGDSDMPRVQSGAFGASQRFAISPGHESEAYLNIAGGQSGHPLSRYYRAGFDAWATGTPLPLLPGKPEHRLTLTPQ